MDVTIIYLSCGKRYTAVLSIAVMGALIMLMTSCASFRKSETPDLTPFTDQTVAMAGDVYFSVAGVRTVYIREYLDRPEVRKLVLMG